MPDFDQPAGAELASRGERAPARQASVPIDIRPRGWRDIAIRVWANIGRHRVLAIAAGVTFYALLALFPGIAAVLAVYGLFADPRSVAHIFDELSAVLPGGGQDILRDQLTRITTQPSAGLGLAFILGLGTSLWTASSGVRAFVDSLNIVYAEEEKRGLFKLYVFSLIATVALIVFFIIVMLTLIALPVALDYAGLGDLSKVLIDVMRWPLLLCLVAIGITAIYRWGPSRNPARWRWINWGSAFATLAWLAVSLLFTWYAANFGSYNKTYGSLGAVVGFMTWIWLSTIAILLGAEVNAEMEHQTVRDTTAGPGKPMGDRGARMADQVGQART